MKNFLFILLVTVFGFASYSQESQILTIQNDTAKIILESLSIEVEVVGNIATTTTEMV